MFYSSLNFEHNDYQVSQDHKTEKFSFFIVILKKGEDYEDKVSKGYVMMKELLQVFSDDNDLKVINLFLPSSFT